MSNATESTRLVTFRLGEHLFAAEIHAVQRVLRYEAPRALPDMPDWMEGVVDYQGTMVPVIDMRRRFAMVASEPGPQSRLMVCSAPGGLAAMLVDAVIIQDMAVARLVRRFFPGLKLHASTQMTIHNTSGVLQLAELRARPMLQRFNAVEE